MLTKQIRQILAIISLILFISPVLLIIVHLLGSHIHTQYRDLLNSWQTQPQVMAASMRYHLNTWILGIVSSIFIARVARIVFNLLSRVNKKYLSSFGIFALLLLGISLLLVSQHTVLYCERIKDTCFLTRTGLWWSKNEQFPLQNLQGAYVRVNNNSDSTTGQVSLVTRQGEILMTDLLYSPGWQSETARQINAFVMQPKQKSLRVYEDDRWISITICIVITMMAIVILPSFL